MVPRMPSQGSDAEDYYDIADATSEPAIETRITFNGGGAGVHKVDHQNEKRSRSVLSLGCDGYHIP